VLAFCRGLTGCTRWFLLWAGLAAIAALTRPDGLLLVAATVAVAGWSLWRTRRFAATATALAPLLLVAAHVGFRVAFYGEWLPNTYYAKVTGPWPTAGLRYLACFLLEHGAWLWPLVAIAWLAVELRRGAAAFRLRLAGAMPAVVATAAVLAHVGYYVVRVGGDPFEYRVLSQLVPLGALATAAMAARIAGSGLAVACSLAVLGASGFGWLHLALHEPTLSPFYRPIAAKAPALLRPLLHWHDRNQAWLKIQVLCGRRGAHALFLESMRAQLPPRQRRDVDAHDVPVVAFTGVGLGGWVLPDIAVLDLLGLNDWVVARTPVAEKKDLLPPGLLDQVLATADTDGALCYSRDERAAAGLPPERVGCLRLLFAERAADSLQRDEAAAIAPFLASIRFMAHERLAPPGYVDALDANVTVDGGQVVVRQRDQPLTEARVREIEAEWRARVGR
jgi:hypothetical protein